MGFVASVESATMSLQRRHLARCTRAGCTSKQTQSRLSGGIAARGHRAWRSPSLVGCDALSTLH
eukprot:4927298-Pleurochrysis_carterae.AAC.2